MGQTIILASSPQAYAPAVVAESKVTYRKNDWLSMVYAKSVVDGWLGEQPLWVSLGVISGSIPIAVRADQVAIELP